MWSEEGRVPTLWKEETGGLSCPLETEEGGRCKYKVELEKNLPLRNCYVTFYIVGGDRIVG